MTRKEATEIIQKLIEASDLWDCTKEAEALRMAIEALSVDRELINLKQEFESAEADRPMGHWLDSNCGEGAYRCSNCGEVQCCNDNYCPNCGAKMSKGGDSE